MKNIKSSLKLIFTITLLGFLLNGCAGNREPQVTQYNSGIEKTEQWNQYNEYAIKNKQPILDFAATTLKYKFGDFTVTNYETFLASDPKVVIQTKWHNCNEKDIFEFKFYAPDGRFAHYDYFIPNRINTKWTIGRTLYLKGTPIEQLQGTWNLEIYVNGKFVINKEFNIVKFGKIEKAEKKVTIGFAPYWNSKDSTWNHNKSAPFYISCAALKDNPSMNIVPPFLILKDVGNPQFDYKTFKEQVEKDLLDNQGTIKSLLKLHPMDYIVMGKVKSAWNMSTHDTNFETLIIDTKSMEIIDTVETKISLGSGDFNIATRQKTEYLHPKRVKIYKQLYNDLANKINSLVK